MELIARGSPIWILRQCDQSRQFILHGRQPNWKSAQEFEWDREPQQAFLRQSPDAPQPQARSPSPWFVLVILADLERVLA